MNNERSFHHRQKEISCRLAEVNRRFHLKITKCFQICSSVWTKMLLQFHEPKKKRKILIEITTISLDLVSLCQYQFCDAVFCDLFIFPNVTLIYTDGWAHLWRCKNIFQSLTHHENTFFFWISIFWQGIRCTLCMAICGRRRLICILNHFISCHSNVTDSFFSSGFFFAFLISMVFDLNKFVWNELCKWADSNV